MAEYYSIIYIHHIFFIHSSLVKDCFSILTIKTMLLWTPGVHAYLFQIGVCFFRYMPHNWNFWSYGSFSLLRKLHTIFFSGCTNLHFHWLCTSIPFSVHSRNIYYLCAFWWYSHSDLFKFVNHDFDLHFFSVIN